MKNWNEFNRSAFMDVAFSAEKSVEDELDRVSKAEVSTMLISYLAMFLYIAVGLGTFKGSLKCFVRIECKKPFPIFQYDFISKTM